MKIASTREIALHEAAHAVVAAHLGLGVARVTLQETVAFGAQCELRPAAPDVDQSTAARLRSIVSLAGMVAHHVATGRPPRECMALAETDVLKAYGMMRQFVADEAELERVMDEVWARTDQLVRELMPHIRRLARALLEHETVLDVVVDGNRLSYRFRTE